MRTARFYKGIGYAVLVLLVVLPIAQAAGGTDVVTEKMYDWRIECGPDRKDGARMCQAFNKTLDVAYVRSGVVIQFVFEERRYPKTTIQIQFPDGTVYKDRWLGFWIGKEADQIVARFMKEPRVRTRHTEWPNPQAIETDINLKGFAGALEFMRNEVHAHTP